VSSNIDKTEGVENGLIVGIGASAGGLAAFSSFLAGMPADSGMAFVLVQHLSPQHQSILTDLLARTTRMAVLEAQDDMPVAADHVYVIPPDSTLTIKQRRIRYPDRHLRGNGGARSTHSSSPSPRTRAKIRSALYYRGPEQTGHLD
jgi:chemotaxis response regulator CheB